MMVVDASALFKLIVKEDGTKLVRDIFLKETSAGEPIEIPDVAVSEVLNALWVSYNLKRSINKSALDSAVVGLDMVLENLDIIPARLLKDIALKVAILKNISVYDSMYIAASLLKGAPLLSFDKELQKKASEVNVQVLGRK